jgi:O-antigen/teichoic acid export membrane protein
MSRKRRFIFALGSGYVALVANILYTGTSIPLALHYLTREEFGLWAVVLQLTGYLALLDLGVGVSVSRLLVDAKDDINGGIYGSILKTASVARAFQACIVVAIGFLFSHPLSSLMGIPPRLAPTFETLLQWQCVAMSFSRLAAPFGYLPLWSHQRLDLINFASVALFAANFLFLWIGFKIGLRTFSLLLSNVAGTVVIVSLLFLATTRLKLLPSRSHWGTLSWERSREVFHFSRDLFIVGLAGQLISASQVILVSRLLGLDAAAVWSVCTKSYNMAQLVIFRVCDSACAGFSEMIVRGEIARFRSRLASIVLITAVGAGFFGVLGAFANRGFVNLWTGGRVSWDMWSDIAAGAYLFSFAVTRCYTELTVLVKNVGNYKYFSLLEGVLGIVGGLILAPRFHFFGVLLASLLANLLCSGAYGAFRVSRYFNTSMVEVTFGWLKSAFVCVVAFALAAGGIFWLGSRFSGPFPFLITTASAGLAGIVIALLCGIPSEIRQELMRFGTSLWRQTRKWKEPARSAVSEPMLSTASENEAPLPSGDADPCRTNSTR